MSTPHPVHPERGEMRASDADRTLVENVLTSAYADGRLTKDELDERLALVWQAKTFNQLTPITQDLVATPGAQQYATPTTSTSDLPMPRMMSAPARTPESYSALLGTKRAGREWHVANRTNALSILGELRLDAVEATFETHTPEINLQCHLGEVRIRVPAGVTVVDRTTSVMAEVKTLGLEPGETPVVLTLTGTVLMGDIQVIGPDHRKWRRWR